MYTVYAAVPIYIYVYMENKLTKTATSNGLFLQSENGNDILPFVCATETENVSLFSLVGKQ